MTNFSYFKCIYYAKPIVLPPSLWVSGTVYCPRLCTWGGQDRVFYGRMDLNMRLFLKFLYLNAEDEIGHMVNFQQKGNRSRIRATFNQLLFGP